MIPPLLLAAALCGPGEPQALESLPHAELSRALRELRDAHPELCELLAVGHSRAGRPIEALRIRAGTEDDGRPAILLVAGLEGPMAYTSALALHHAQGLLAGHGESEDIRALLEGTTLYILPRANPDACEARHGAPLAERRASGQGFDTDRDGRLGEDDVSDVDGDGIVAWMRYEDPEGTWIEDPTDPRVLVEATRASGQRGRWKLVREGLDDDGDGAIGEDALLDAEVNRNFPHAFEEHTPRAGLFATSEPESRALCDFVLAHPEIALVVCYGETMNVAKDPRAAPEGGRGTRGRLPPREVLAEDAVWLGELGRRYREVTGNRAQGSEDDAGTFQGWAYHHRGLATLAIRPFEIPLPGERPARAGRTPAAPTPEAPEGEPPPSEAAPETAPGEVPATEPPPQAPPAQKPSDDARRLAWLAAQGVTDAHLGWTPFEHPDLGPIEIGGLRPYAFSEPPAALGAQLAEKHLGFLVSLGPLLARPRLVEVRARELAPGLVELGAVLENGALLPLETAAGRRARARRPARVDLLLPEGARIVAGPPFELVRELAGVGGRRELRWLVRGAAPADLALALDSDHAGRARARAEESR